MTTTTNGRKLGTPSQPSIQSLTDDLAYANGMVLNEHNYLRVLSRKGMADGEAYALAVERLRRYVRWADLLCEALNARQP